MKLPCGNLAVFEHRRPIPMRDAADTYAALCQPKTPAFLFESRSINPLYGRMSLIGVDPVLELTAQGDRVCLRVLQLRGEAYFADFLASGILELADSVEQQSER